MQYSSVTTYTITIKHSAFLRAAALSAKRVLAIVILSVRPSVTTRYRFKPRWKRDSGSSPYDNLESLVSKFCAAGWGDYPRMMASKRGTALRNRYFTTIRSSSVRTVADKHIIAAYRNKHCWRAFRGTNIDDFERSCTPKYGFLLIFFAISGFNAHFKSEFSPKLLEIDQEKMRTKLHWCCRASHEH